MKRIIIAAALMFGFAVAAAAQPKAVGLRFGYGVEASYQHNINGLNFIEADLGLGGFSYLSVAGTYNFMIAQPEWTSTGDWGFYAGPGIALGVGSGLFNIGIAGQAGLEYKFDGIPLHLSIDIRPQIGLVTASAKVPTLNDNLEIKEETIRASEFGIWGWYPHIGVRYVF